MEAGYKLVIEDKGDNVVSTDDIIKVMHRADIEIIRELREEGMDDVIDSHSCEGLYAEAGGSEAEEDKQTSNHDSVDAEDSADAGVISEDEAEENTMDGTEEDEHVVKDPVDENNKFGDSPRRGSGTEDRDED